MTFLLADLLTPTLQPQNTAGAVVAAPAEGEAGAFAVALAAFRAGTVESRTGEAGIVLQGATPAADTSAPAASPPAATVIGLDAVLMAADPSAIPAPATFAPVQAAAGNVLPTDAEQALSQLLAGTVKDKDKAADASSDATAADGSQMVAGLVVPATPADTVAANFTNNADMALKLAGTKPLTPPTLDTPEGAKAAAAAMPAPLQEGRASVAGPPPVYTGAPSAPVVTPEVPVLTQKALEAVAPRAVADTATATGAVDAVSKPVDPAGMSAPAAASAPAAPATASAPVTGAAAPVPDAAREIASTPNVVSVQGKVVARDKPAIDDAPPVKANAPAPAATPTEDAAAPSSASGTPVVTAPVIPAPETALAASPATEAEAADAALAVLTKEKDKPDAKPVAAQPSSAAPAPVTVPEDTEAGVPKLAATDDTAVRTTDAEPEDVPADKSPAASEKPAVAAEPRAAQPQAPVTDKPVLADAVAKTQQQANNLPAAAIPQIASEIATHFKKGATRFEIRLDPPELGRVDVRIDVDTDGRVTSRMTVEKTETLDLLKADQRALERALNEAGFKSEQNSLSFSLKDDRGGGGQPKFEDLRQMREQAATRIQSEEEPMRLAAGIAYRAAMRGPGGFDLRV